MWINNFERMKNINKNRGFTLIELLVVISIISLLAMMGIAALRNGQMKGRDAVRKADLAQIRKALEMYFDDNNSYPPPPGGYGSNSYYNSGNGTWGPFEAYLAPYMDRVPVDPLNELGSPWNGFHAYTYGNTTDGSDSGNPHQYDLTAALESTSDPDRCGVKLYTYYYIVPRTWCTADGQPGSQVYEASPY